MGKALIKIKIMPASPEADLDAIKTKAEEVLKNNSAEEISFNEEPIAFGLKALILGFSIDESKELLG